MRLVDDAGAEHRIDAVLFDMDGTLVDSVAATERAWRTWADIHGVTDRLHIAHGQPADTTIRMTIPEIDDEALARHVAEQRVREASDVVDVVPTAGARELLAWLESRGLTWTIVTSADLDLARARLQAAGIEYSSIVTRDEVTHGKPHPEPFLLGAERVGVAPENCLVVEDTQAGVDSGRAAGAVTAGLGRLDADLLIDDLVHLRRLLDAART